MNSVEIQQEEQNEIQPEEQREEQNEIQQEENLEGKETTLQDKKKKIRGAIVECAIYVCIALICFIVVPKYVVQRTQVSGPSMEETLQDEDSLLVEKLSYRFGKPERFDIVVFYHFLNPDNRDKKDSSCYEFYVKRIIGLPGETVQIDGEDIYINGEKLQENYGKDPISYQGVAEEPFTLDEDEYFVLGDNRTVSKDSRYAEVGNIKREDLVGKVWLRLYPLKEFGFLDHQ